MSGDAEAAIELVMNAWRDGRPIVPFVGAGISIAAGFPDTARLTRYLAQTKFALDNAIYKSRYPFIPAGLEKAEDFYRRRPAEFIADFNWPEIGQLNADIWRWIDRTAQGARKRDKSDNDLIQNTDQAVRSVLLERLEEVEPHAAASMLDDKSLRGDWTALLDYLAEGQLDLIDALFVGLDKDRIPSRAHLFLTFLVQLMGIRLVLTTNFDTLIEQAMHREGLRPRVFDVHRDAELPHPRLVRQQLSIIKLAGSAYGLRFGERLQYSLDENARVKMRDYLPDEALLVVIGFSGWERRMMQVISEFAKRPTSYGGHTKVLWLTTSPLDQEPSRFVTQIEHELESYRIGSFERMQICNVNSFLPALYYRIASAFPAARQKYEALTSRPAIPRLGKDTIDPVGQLDSPSVMVVSDLPLSVLLSDEPPSTQPSSWPTLTVAEIASRQRDRDVLWIDLENHHSLAAVVKGLFEQIRRLDPQSPHVVIPGEPSSDLSQGRAKKRRAHNNSTQTMAKIVERLREALQRGRYLIVFDSLESFSRPQLVHHGMPLWGKRCEAHRLFVTRVKQLCDFLCMLIGVDEEHCPRIHPPLCDTIIVLGVTAPGARHSGSTNPFVTAIRSQLKALLTERITRNALPRVPPTAKRVRYKALTRDDLKRTVWSERFRDHANAKPLQDIIARRTRLSAETYVGFAARSVRLRNQLRASREVVPTRPSSRIALLCLLSFFRRARPLPLIRSLFARWLFEPGDLHTPGQMTACIQSLHESLQAMARERWLEVFEGDTVWIPREIYEPLYATLTDPLRLRSMPAALRDTDASVVALMTGLLASTWHLQAARVYFSDVYLSTHDEQAFFEYIYHRIAGLRCLVRVQILLDEAASSKALIHERFQRIENLLGPRGRPSNDPALSKWEPASVARDKEIDNATRVADLVAAQYPRFATLVLGLATFSSVRQDTTLHQQLGALHGKATAADALRLAIYHCRRHALETLCNTIVREVDRISESTTPDTWLGWIDQLLSYDLPEIAGEWSVLLETQLLTMEAAKLKSCFLRKDLHDPLVGRGGFHQECLRLRRALVRLQLRLLRTTLDFPSAKKRAATEIVRSLNLSKSRSERLRSDICKRGSAATGAHPDGPTAWQRSLAFVVDEKCDHDEKIHLLRCWIELASALDGEGNSSVAIAVLSRLVKDLEDSAPSVHRRVAFQRLANEAKAIQTESELHRIPMWRYFDFGAAYFDRMNATKTAAADLIAVERRTHALEDFARGWSRNAMEYAEIEVGSLGMRARALYQRTQFREAHRVLTRATSDIGHHSFDARRYRAIGHLYRAELLAISADWHLQHSGNVLPSIRKIETAVERLEDASRLLAPATHSTIWWLRLCVGRAQLRHEQILLEARRLCELDTPVSWSYAQRSIWLEQCVLDSLHALAMAFDMHPFSREPEKRGPGTTDPLVAIEFKLLALWVQLFVAAFAYNHMLITHLQFPALVSPSIRPTQWSEYLTVTRDVVDDLTANRMLPLASLIRPDGFWDNKWKHWCEMCQVYRLVDDRRPDIRAMREFLTTKMTDFRSSASEHGAGDERHTLREEIIKMENMLIKEGRIDQMLWTARRSFDMR